MRSIIELANDRERDGVTASFRGAAIFLSRTDAMRLARAIRNLVKRELAAIKAADMETK